MMNHPLGDGPRPDPVPPELINVNIDRLHHLLRMAQDAISRALDGLPVEPAQLEQDHYSIEQIERAYKHLWDAMDLTHENPPDDDDDDDDLAADGPDATPQFPSALVQMNGYEGGGK